MRAHFKFSLPRRSAGPIRFPIDAILGGAHAAIAADMVLRNRTLDLASQPTQWHRSAQKQSRAALARPLCADSFELRRHGLSPFIAARADSRGGITIYWIIQRCATQVIVGCARRAVVGFWSDYLPAATLRGSRATANSAHMCAREYLLIALA